MIRVTNGEWVEASVAADLPSGVPGVFETVLLRGGELLFWTEHWARFAAGCEAFGVPLPLPDQALRELSGTVAARNALADGVLRFATWRAEAHVHWQLEVTPSRPHMHKPQFTAVWGRPITPEPATSRFKHFHRGSWLAALRQARHSGADEVLLCNGDGDLIEAAVSNVFVVSSAGVLLTPPLTAGPLAGIMRGRVLAFAGSLGWDVKETTVPRAQVARASEVWVTNSLIGIRPLSHIGEAALPAGRPRLDCFRSRWNEHYGWDPVAIT